MAHLAASPFVRAFAALAGLALGPCGLAPRPGFAAVQDIAADTRVSHSLPGVAMPSFQLPAVERPTMVTGDVSWECPSDPDCVPSQLAPHGKPTAAGGKPGGGNPGQGSRKRAPRRLMKPRVVIAERDSMRCGKLRELLAKAWPQAEVAAVAHTGVAAVRALHDHHPGVLFLDMEIPDRSAFDVAREASGRCHVVFVVARDRHAEEALQQADADYLAAPFSAGRFTAVVSRVKDRLQSPPPHLEGVLSQLAAAPAPRECLRWIVASRRDQVQLIAVDDIRYFRSDSKYTRVATSDGDAFIHRTIKELNEELDPAVFWQVHRSTIVNVNSVANVARDLNGHVVLQLKDCCEVLQVSQPFAHLFRQM